MNMNIGKLDRLIRIIIGATLIGLAYIGSIGLWGHIGIIPLATALFKWCPLYTIIGVNTCPLNETTEHDNK